MPVKVKDAFTPPMAGNQADWTILCKFALRSSLQALAVKFLKTQSLFEEIRAGAIISPRWVHRRYGHKLRQQRGHLFLALLQPR
jgi:hypothetical protein